MSPPVDLRSDTVTQPTEAMREAMRAAAVGDDVFGEDPTVNRLEEMAAARMGKEAAVFVPSGTMANLAAIMSHTQRGDEVVVEERAHCYLNEAGGMAALAGVIPRPLPGERGILAPAQIEAVLRPPNLHFAPTRLLCLENTHNAAGGVVMSPQQMTALCATAHVHGLRVHLDGARIFNAAVALGVDVRLLVQDADSVMFCISKGLSAPVGSLLCGSAEFVARARRARKMVGGGMRQAGVLAAAGIVALETMVDRLADDHRHARVLAQRLAEIPGLRVDPANVQTNMVLVEVPQAPLVARQLAAHGVLVLAVAPCRLRLVTHRHIGLAEVERAVEAFARVASQVGREQEAGTGERGS
ncbi:MAG: low-specificity L-threonine aldolase [Armatimonadota bacterium]|nr:low-specificity L-threonine aldolase [Armatimonadota bacterium]